MQRAEIVRASKFVQLPRKYQKKLVSSGFVIPINDKFIPYFGIEDKIVLLYGSYGNGKSKFVAQDSIERCRFDKYFKCYYGRKVKDNVRGSIFDEIVTEIEERKLEHEFNYSRADNSSMIITHIKTGNKFIPFGADNSKNLKSIKDASRIICEEFDQFSEQDFGFLFSRLRTEKAITQFYGMFNSEPLIDGHWLRKMFFDKQKPHDATIVFGIYKDNFFIDHAEYLKKLELIANGREHVLQSIANGELGVMLNNNPFFYAYENFMYKDEPFDLQQNSNIILQFDFNKEPCTLSISMINYRDKEFSWFDCLLADPKTLKNHTPLQALCIAFNRKYVETGIIHPAYITVTGDASGQAGSADRKENDNFYSTIVRELNIASHQIKVRNKNQAHTTSREQCNAMLYRIKCVFYRSAKLLTTDLEIAYADDKGTLNEAKKDKKLGGLHFADNFRYGVDFMLNFDNWKETIDYYKGILGK